MAKLNLTAKTVGASKAGARVDYIDTSLPGFFVRATPSGVKTFGVRHVAHRKSPPALHDRRHRQSGRSLTRDEAREALRSAAKGKKERS